MFAKRGVAKATLIAMALLLACSAFLLTQTLKASATGPSCGDVIVAGSSWAGGQGVDIHSNALMTETLLGHRALEAQPSTIWSLALPNGDWVGNVLSWLLACTSPRVGSSRA